MLIKVRPNVKGDG